MGIEVNITEAEAHELVSVLERENDIVRIVDPETREILYWPAVESGRLDIPCTECNAVWGRGQRCPNCSSLEAIRSLQRTYKMELNESRAYWVNSRPLIMDGKRCVMETVNDVTDGLMVEGSNRGMVASLVDNLNSLVITDAMTGLLNRRFLEEFNQRLSDLERGNVRINVAMIDLDEMKDVNDTYGHQAGDAVLRDVAGFLKLNFNGNSSNRERYAVRYGGDEFVVIEVDGDFDEFTRDINDHYSSMRRICYFDGIGIPFTLSIGMATSDEVGWSWEALLDAADRRMYADKRLRDGEIASAGVR